MRNRSIRSLAVAVAAVLVVTLAPPAASQARAATLPTAPQKEPVVPVEPVPVKEDPLASMAGTKALPAPRWPDAGAADVRLGATAVAAGKLPIRVASGKASAGRAAPAGVRVQVRDQGAARSAGVAGLVFDVRRTDEARAPGPVTLTVDYSGFRYAYGGDWASRLRLVRLTDRSVVPSRNDHQAGTLTAQVDVTAESTAFAVTAGASGASGDYGATPLALSDSWQVSAHTGDFSWSYPLRMPETPGGLAPQLSLSYSSGAIDGRTAATNNQPSWVGDGFDMWSGYIERSYRGCGDDLDGNNGKRATGDQCWFNHNATLSLAGHSGQLVPVTDTEWRLKQDDGTRIQRLTNSANGNGDNDGEYWKVTTRDGTQYFFGVNRLPGWTGNKPETQSVQTVPVFGNHSGEPCYQSTFAASACDQAYRWNLDHVIDPRNNTITYWYEKEKNAYGADGGQRTLTYDRAAILKRAEFGTRLGGELAGAPPAKVVFETESRCAPGKDCGVENSASYPDVPFDQKCAANCTTQQSPTFWTTKRLARVITYAGSDDVDKWTLDHSFPDPGDAGAGAGPSLWLARIVHTGLAGGGSGLDMPPVTFRGLAYDNRVNSGSDGLPPLAKFRLTGVYNEYGGVVSVNYANPECQAGALPTPEGNKLRCFPVQWQPDGGVEFTDWMHKYVVSSVTQTDRVGGAATEVESYQYLDGGAWRYNDNEIIVPKRRTWSEWRGYGKVVVTHGEAGGTRSATEYRYFRGMGGTVRDSRGGTASDADPLSGQLLERTIYNDVGGPVVSTTINAMYQRQTAASGNLKAHQVDVASVRDFVALGAGKWRRTQVDRAYKQDSGLLERVDDHGDLDVNGDEECTRTWYNGYRPERTETVAVACSATPVYPRDVISDTRTTYDSAGNPVKAEQVSGYANGQAVYTVTNRATYDEYGRPRETWDALGRKTTTTYTQTGGLTTKMTVTNEMDPDDADDDHTTTTELAPAWGEPTASIDPNGRRTTVRYDALGRVVGVWLPGRRADIDESPNLRYRYFLRSDGASAVATDSLRANGNYLTSYALYDGFLRPRQTQSPAWGEGGVVEGRVITDTDYDSRGLAVKTNDGYYAEGAPGTTLVRAGDNNVPAQNVVVYDGVERPIRATLHSFGEPQWSGAITYHGDRTDVTPPAGGIPTTTYVDADGKTTELHQRKPDGTADITRYTYTKTGQVATITAPDGRQWRYEYDLFGRRVTEQDPDTGTSRSTYDAAGQLITRTNGAGQTLAFVYDPLGRKIEERADSVTGPLRAKWTFDTLLKGLPTSSTRFAGDQQYTVGVTGYDTANRPTGSVVTIPLAEGELAGSYQTKVTYRADDSVATTELPGIGGLAKETLSVKYDDLGLPKSTSSELGTYVDETQYTRFSELAQLAVGADGGRVWSTHFYDYATRRSTRSLVEREAPSDVKVNDLRYTYDPAGNILKIEDLPSGAPADRQCFGYDHLRRMTEAWTTAGDCVPGTVGGTNPYWTSYRYDASGNRTEQRKHGLSGAADTVMTYAYSDTSHALRSVTTTGPGGSSQDTFGYDVAGNTTSRNLNGSTQTLTWDRSGRLDSARSADGEDTRIVYDADGNRLLRHDPTTVTLYLGGQELRLDRATGAKQATRYYSHAGVPIGVRTTSGLYWQVADHHGTSVTTLAANESLAVTRRQFLPFGEVRGDPPAAWPDEHDFVGGRRDDSLGLVQLGAREYDPALGRFISVDPIIDPGDPQQLNGYAYANNSPVSASDPDGLKYFLEADGSVYISSKKHASKQMIQRAVSKAAKAARSNKKIKQMQDAAFKASGHTREEYEQAKRIQNTSLFDVVIEAGGEILQEVLGINDIKACFGGGSIGACVSMIIGIIPWGKLHRIGELVSAVKKAWNAVVNFGKMKAWAQGVMKAMNKAAKSVSDFIRDSYKGPMSACKHSFRADTKVRMADGRHKRISEVKLGDKVLATDPATGRTTERRVTAVHVNRDTDLTDVTVTVRDKPAPARRAGGARVALAGLAVVGAVAAGTTTVLHTTDHHPFWDQTAGTWVNAADLMVGHELRTTDGRVATVAGVRSYAGAQTMHDLTVDALHTYDVIAGDSPVLVHNCGGGVNSKGEACDCANLAGTAARRDLKRTHSIGGNASSKFVYGLMQDMRANGYTQAPLAVVSHGGEKFVVDGHHRLAAAKRAGISEIPYVEVELPFAGYRTADDLMDFVGADSLRRKGKPF